MLADQTGAPADPAILIQNLAGLFPWGIGLPQRLLPYNQRPFLPPMAPGRPPMPDQVSINPLLLSYVRLPAMAATHLLGAPGQTG